MRGFGFPSRSLDARGEWAAGVVPVALHSG